MTMNEQELRDARDLQEVSKMMKSRGWAVALVSLNAERENIISVVAGAEARAPEHGWEYYQGKLAGFQKAVAVFDRLRFKWEEILELSRKEEEERNAEFAGQ